MDLESNWMPDKCRFFIFNHKDGMKRKDYESYKFWNELRYIECAWNPHI